jgi:hypothetical protein
MIGSHGGVVGSDGLFWVMRRSCVIDEFEKIDRLVPIAAETRQLADRQNFSLKSTAQISDGSWRRVFLARRKNLRRKISALPWLKMIEWE